MFARNLSRLGILAAALLASTAALAQVSDDVVKIGVLTDMNGPAATPTGQGSVTSAQMAIDDFGGKVLGKPISIIVGDHQLKPDIGGAIARRWYDVEQVDLIVDVPVSAVGLAVQNIANDKKKLFITHSTLAADFHGKFCSPYAMQWVIDTRSLAAGNPSEWMSVISASNAAICWPPLSTPNSAAVLISFMLFGGPAAMPMIFAFEACACSTKDDRSGVASGGRTEPSTLPPLAVTTEEASRSSEWPNA